MNEQAMQADQPNQKHSASTQKKVKKRIALALGSGGARGLAHIGILRWLDEHDYEVVAIAGTSAGALVGGMYAAGELDDLEQWARALSRTDMITILDLSWQNDGLFKGEKVIGKLEEMVEHQDIAELPIPFSAVAADIVTHEEVVLDQGPLFDAIRASISLPVFFTPKKKNQRVMVDGGIINPVPISVIKDVDADMVVAVNLCGKPKYPGELDKSTFHAVRQSTPEPVNHSLQGRIHEYLKDIKASLKSIGKINMGSYQVLDHTIDTMQYHLNELRTQTCPADVMITIPSDAGQVMDFHMAATLIKLGYESAAEAFSALDN